MTILLSFNYHVGRNAFVAHCLRIRFVVFACFVHFVAHFRGRETVVTLDFTRVHSLTFQLLFLEPIIKRNVGSVRNELFVEAMHAFCVGAMLTKHFGLALFIFQVYGSAV